MQPTQREGMQRKTLSRKQCKTIATMTNVCQAMMKMMTATTTKMSNYEKSVPNILDIAIVGQMALS
jgi:hypothetical protein